MQLESTPAPAGGHGVGGPVRLAAILLIGALAALGILTVFEVIPRSLFADWAGKLALAAGIVAVAAVAAALVLRLGRRG